MSGLGRREFLVGIGGAAAALAVRTLGGQQPQSANFAPMDQAAYRPTIRPAKPDAVQSMTDLERDALEKSLKCQCTCTLDVYTCRTTDFSCSVSPAMHRDVMRLVDGGYSGDEILAAFVETYGEVALTYPRKEGFNWTGYLAPGVAMATGAVVLTLLLRKWSLEAQRTSAALAAGRASAPDAAAPAASNDEMERLERALREDG
jgi:cytochrome c-type biogenesis protein CcmH